MMKIYEKKYHENQKLKAKKSIVLNEDWRGIGEASRRILM